jgi:hypothetical protein
VKAKQVIDIPSECELNVNVRTPGAPVIEPISALLGNETRWYRVSSRPCIKDVFFFLGGKYGTERQFINAKDQL